MAVGGIDNNIRNHISGRLIARAVYTSQNANNIAASNTSA